MTNRHRPTFWLLDGRTPVPTTDMRAWCEFLEADGDLRRVALDAVDCDVDGGPTVSTVFLGMDHNWRPSGPALLFETCIFGGPLDGEMQRYATWEEAERGHQAMLEEARIEVRVIAWQSTVVRQDARADMEAGNE